MDYNAAVMNELESQTVNSPNLISENVKKLKKRPKETPLRQQRIPGFQPIVTPWIIIFILFIAGIASTLLAIVLYLSNNPENQMYIQYKGCNKGYPAICNISFHLDEDFDPPVYFYYHIKNYYQNFRAYVASRSYTQLRNKNNDDLKNVDTCDTLQKDSKPTAPCGLIANSMLNDTYTLYKMSSSNQTEMERIWWTHKKVIWDEDRYIFQNPGEENCKKQNQAELKHAFKDTLRPNNWNKDVWELDTDNSSNTCNNGFLNTDFIVWMRVAGMPIFRKLYRIYNDILYKGDYTLSIISNYPVRSFDGEKSFLILTTSWAGAYNFNLVITCFVVGILCIIIAGILLFAYLKFAHRATKIKD